MNSVREQLRNQNSESFELLDQSQPKINKQRIRPNKLAILLAIICFLSLYSYIKHSQIQKTAHKGVDPKPENCVKYVFYDDLNEIKEAYKKKFKGWKAQFFLNTDKGDSFQSKKATFDKIKCWISIPIDC